ncbi:MAG: triose-phosphate isomerase [Methanocalculus sp. MSAO_Arc1]|uniref:triose-phosphate isomerase n=1 Tax=Methanocalculus TaxID=71151 RepID=UPI000FF64A06|nr:MULTISPECIES: triose-phosphate isomerase [unclassified Methanocalculus]MCP1661952.1 triosephosphate isomerase [Methanocalculus sp. AMF5]RQD80535.1 MAG: triose-phosphate isomerase [Methanocalculus sp. MSAO_Arc1]
MQSPFILINFKTYREGTGYLADRIARAAQAVMEDMGVRIAIAPHYTEMRRLAKHYSIPVFAQHIDGVGGGAYTGHTPAFMVKSAGGVGTLINHSEKRLALAEIEAALAAAREEELTSVICTNNILTTAAGAALGPDYVAIEPPELIGSGISVAKADPEIIAGSVKAAEQQNDRVLVLAGAGIQSGECLRTALDLGCAGVLLASGVVKAEDPEAVLLDLVSMV